MGPSRTHSTLLERTRLLIGAAAVLAAVAVAALVLNPGGGQSEGAIAPARAGQLAWPVPGSRDSIKVEVLNGTSRDGLAVDVTRLLRSRGFDVVVIGNAQSSESTRVLARRGNGEAARRVARALGQGQPELAPDSLRFVDVTVIVGSDFNAELPLHP